MSDGGLSDPSRQGGSWGFGDASLQGKLHHIGMRCPHAGWRAIMLVAGLDVRVLGLDGRPLRHLTLDPSATTSGCPGSAGSCLRCLEQMSPMSRDIKQSAPLGIRTRNLRIKSPLLCR